MTSMENNVKKISEAISECHISPSIEASDKISTVIADVLDPDLCSKWPKVKIRVPDVYLHKPADFAHHLPKLFSLGIKFNRPYLGRYHTKISCPTYEDQRAMIQFFEKNQLPYHTFGNPSKRKMKVVIRGLPDSIDAKKIKSELKYVSVPVVRVHLMQRCDNITDNTSLVLAVVPFNDEGKKILRIQKLLGYDIKMEPPKPKTKQCHRCQLWGHTQRYCHGQIKCVKCAGDHMSKRCRRDATKEPPKCANCNGAHTANYRQCPCCPDSKEHTQARKKKARKMQVLYRRTVLVTQDNCSRLYKNVEL